MHEIRYQQSSDPLVTRLAPAEPRQESANIIPRAPERPRKLSLHETYRLPVPLRTFPFPTLTSNPVSWIHLAVTWLGQVFSPPPAEPSIVHTAYWESETMSIVVTDPTSMAALWQQGFYGKGTFSRSEPNWLKREKIRQGVVDGKVAEVNTDNRREDRARVKWERARAEQDALEQRRLEEAVPPKCVLPSPVASREPSPDGIADSVALAPERKVSSKSAPSPPVGPLQLLALPNSHIELAAQSHARFLDNSANGDDPPVTESDFSGNDGADSSSGLKRRKSVRFSSNVQSAFFEITDPPSPPDSVASSSLKLSPVPVSDDTAVVEAEQHVLNTPGAPSDIAAKPVDGIVENKEHLQLAPEEAYFLAFALGALKVVNQTTQAVIPTADLLTLLRQHSYFPPRVAEPLQPDDPFLIHYAVYHHFRSLGWVPRPGVKFGVNWLLYTRGPVFDHAEYGLSVLPSYAHPYWKAHGRQQLKKSWHWLLGVNRVLTKVFKHTVLVYVDIPPPTAFDESGEPEAGMAGLMKEYRIREVMVKRWSSNRNRDL